MSRTVFILGAGASREAGGPLMADFLDIADRLRKTKQVGDAAQSFDLVFKALGALDAAHAKAVLDVDNIESVYGAFEMARLSGRLGSLSQEEAQQLGPAIRRLIVTTLEKCITYPVLNQQALPPPPYREFGEKVAKINASALGPASFITFNYDIALDYMLYSRGEQVDYFGIPEPGRIPVMKLHGSVNWARCARCPNVVPWYLPDFFKKFNWQNLWFRDIGAVRLDIGSKLVSLEHCGSPCLPDPVIVPPTWNKAQYQEVVAVWKQADKHLSEAENIVVIGYSLPETDQFFRFLYALGTIGEARIKNFLVFDPSKEVGERFQRLLGPTARNRFRHFEIYFSNVTSGAFLLDQIGLGA